MILKHFKKKIPVMSAHLHSVVVVPASYWLPEPLWQEGKQFIRERNQIPWIRVFWLRAPYDKILESGYFVKKYNPPTSNVDLFQKLNEVN